MSEWEAGCLLAGVGSVTGEGCGRELRGEVMVAKPPCGAQRPSVTGLSPGVAGSSSSVSRGPAHGGCRVRPEKVSIKNPLRLSASKDGPQRDCLVACRQGLMRGVPIPCSIPMPEPGTGCDCWAGWGR